MLSDWPPGFRELPLTYSNDTKETKQKDNKKRLIYCKLVMKLLKRMICVPVADIGFVKNEIKLSASRNKYYGEK